MSYCRLGDDSDVYVVCTGAGFQIIVEGGNSWMLGTPFEVLSFLEIMRKAAYKVPEIALTRLRNEIASQAGRAKK